MKLSFEQIREKLNKMLPSMYILEMYDDHVICEKDGGGYFSIPYAVAEDGNVTVSEAAEVQRVYEPVNVQAAMILTAASSKQGDADYGYKWRVQIIKYGLGLDKRINWPREPLVAALDKFSSARVFALSDAQHRLSGGKSVREIVGWTENAGDTGSAIEADFNILKAASWLRDIAVDSFERGKPDLIGFSVDIGALTTKKLIAGKQVFEPVKVTGVEVDVVYNPTNEGKFLKMVAASEADQKEADMLEKLLAALKAQRPDLYATIEAKVNDKSITDDEVMQLLASAMQKPADVDGFVEKLKSAMKDDKDAAGEVQKILDQARLVACGITLVAELKASGLSELSQMKLKKQFDGQVFETERLQAAIKDEKEYVDKLTGSGAVLESGQIRDMQTEPERLQAAFDKTFGIKVDEKYKDVPMFEGLRAAYVRMTGDTEVRGIITDNRILARLQAAFASNSFSYVLGNTLYRRMVQDYKELPDYGISRLISSKRNAKDFRTMESVRIAYFGDIPDVDPEAEDYQDLGVLSDEEVSYALNQKGGLLIITRRMIINDDMSAVSKIISRLPRAARRTRAKRVWNKFISNATYKGDSKAVFHADHGNLGSTAYGIASALAAKTAMAQQTEPGSGERLMLRPVTVTFPSELYGIVKNVNDFNPQAVAIGDGNSMFGYFKPEGIIENPFMTDATDWMMFADPLEVEIIEIAFLNGQEEPEMFVADNPAVGQVFVADKIQYKIRMEDECEIVDYRGAYKAVVAG